MNAETITVGVAIIAALIGLFQWMEARKQTSLSRSMTAEGLLKEQAVELHRAIYPSEKQNDIRPAFQTFRDVEEDWCPTLALIPPGRFLMGSPEGELGRFDDERPQHSVSISRAFAIGVHPVTFHQYDYFCLKTKRTTPFDEGWGRGSRPVINVSWEDACAYLSWISSLAGAEYRLPTEAEWEYTARGATGTPFNTGEQISVEDANFARAKRGETTEVCAYRANEWGLYDCHGNVWEWCLDGKRTYEHRHIVDPIGPAGPLDYRVSRGGAWSTGSRYLRSAFRHSDPPAYRAEDMGFRCVRTIL